MEKHCELALSTSIISVCCKHVDDRLNARDGTSSLDPDNTLGQGQFVPRNPFARSAFFQFVKESVTGESDKYQRVKKSNEQKLKKKRTKKTLLKNCSTNLCSVCKTISFYLFIKYCFLLCHQKV